MRRRYSSPRGRVCTGFGWNGPGTPQPRERSVADREEPRPDDGTPRRPGPGGAGGAPGAGAGAGPYSGWNRYATCFTGSTLMVFAPRIVATVATTVYLSGASSCTTVTLLSRPAGM